MSSPTFHGHRVIDTKSSPTFHRFPLLPPEIRLLIWENCCFTRSQRNKGLHYLNSTRLPNANASDYHEHKREWEFAPGDTTLFIDDGLLGACKESRRVLQKHIERQGFMDIEPGAGPNNDGGSTDKVLSLNQYDRYRKARLLECLNFDMFCLRGDSWRIPKPLVKYLENMEYPLTSTVRPSLIRTPRVAFEFDASWNDNFPTNLTQLLLEESPRGALSRAYLHFHHFPCLDPPNVYIIDNNVEWCRRGACSKEGSDTFWTGCNSQYVSVHANNVHYRSMDGASWSARDFFGRFLCLAWRWSCWPIVSENFLVRKDNEVDVCGDGCGRDIGCFMTDHSLSS